MFLNNYTQQEYKSFHIIINKTQTQGSLILGDLNAATDQQLINNYNIKTIITAACGLQHLKIPSKLTHIVFPLIDTKQENIQKYFQLSNQTIEQNLKRGSVLVHCGAGISRSASLIIAYYMKTHNVTFKNAISYVKKIKPNICPNLGFQRQLKNYQNLLSINDEKYKNIQKKTLKLFQRTQIPSSQFVFDLPVNSGFHKFQRNTPKSMNKSFNKTFGPNKSIQKHENKDSLFIQGKNNLDRFKQTMNIFSVYESEKYNPKKRKDGWGINSTIKKQLKRQF